MTLLQAPSPARDLTEAAPNADAIAAWVTDPELVRAAAYVAGRWIEGSSDSRVAVFNPATGKVIGRMSAAGSDIGAAAVDAAAKTFRLGLACRRTSSVRSSIAGNKP